ncbi:thioesterase [Streptomyces gardneri]|uniref:thioesterase II family protein n=1 Tax=Streptomyces gardneri TaxID=66892 RepID=UPI0006E18C19|nr:alpha/beta fold hydrolase [Streptomyces gardneri]QPK44050.1 thioesterase [Streptomyces gardneri]WRK35321.1 alpha/beta fold hydrolase [Streptomyces venezuelae]
MSVISENVWFPHDRSGPSRLDARLFCLPHGGADGSAFRPWQGLLGAGVEVVPVQLPGRGIRMAETAERSIVRLGEELAGPIARRADGLPYVLFGHSMGALLAYELGLALQDGPNPPAAVVVSGAVPPHVPRSTPAMHLLADEEFLGRLGALGGIPPELLAEEEWLELFLPVLRADFEAAETYRTRSTLSPGVRLIALGGSDDPAAPPAEVERWRELGTDVTIRTFTGGHFFPFESTDQVLALVSAACRAR